MMPTGTSQRRVIFAARVKEALPIPRGVWTTCTIPDLRATGRIQLPSFLIQAVGRTVAARTTFMPAYVNDVWSALRAGKAGWLLEKSSIVPGKTQVYVNLLYRAPVGAYAGDPRRILDVEICPGDPDVFVVREPHTLDTRSVPSADFVDTTKGDPKMRIAATNRKWAEYLALRAYRNKCGRVRIVIRPVPRILRASITAGWQWDGLLKLLRQELQVFDAQIIGATETAPALV